MTVLADFGGWACIANATADISRIRNIVFVSLFYIGDYDASVMNKRELRRARIQKARTAPPVAPQARVPEKPQRSKFQVAAIVFLRGITSIPFWCLLAAVWGAISAWLYRDWMNPDGICYMDLAGNALQRGPLALVNAHWSPLYPALIACWTLLFHPTAAQEFAYVHALNGVIYTLAAVCFGFFLNQFISLRSSPGQTWVRRSVFITFGFSLFFLYMNADIIPFAVTLPVCFAGPSETAKVGSHTSPSVACLRSVTMPSRSCWWWDLPC